MSDSIRSGTVLIIVLVILMTVSLAAYNFTLTMESEHIAIRNSGDRFVAQQAAFSGAEVLTAWMELPRQDRFARQSMLGNGLELWPSVDDQTVAYAAFVDFGIPSQRDQVVVSEGASSLVSSDPISASMVDESGKLNLRSLLEWDLASPGQARKSLLGLPDMDEESADRILDWIDVDRDERGRGYEVNARNSLPLYVEEIPWRDFEREDSFNSGRPGWLDMLTVTSAERNESFDGRPRINVNQANLLTLHEQLREVIPLPLANYIVVMRQHGSSQQSGEAIDAAALAIDFGQSGLNVINSLMELIDSQVAIPGNAGVQVVSSPLRIQLGMEGMSIDRILDRLTTHSKSRLVGRVNLLTAPEEVIAGVPGLDKVLAQQIVAGRVGSPGNAIHAFSVLSDAGLDLAVIERVLPSVTVGGDVIRTSLTGHADQQGVELFYQVMIDASGARGRWTALVGDRFKDRSVFEPPAT